MIVLVAGLGLPISCAKDGSDISLSRGEQPPNIILLLADDMRHDAMSCAGNTVVQTANLDDLALNGVRFRNAYVTTSICAISRASILSGQYARRHGITDFNRSFSDTAWRETYPMLLRQAGYRTGFIGKFGVGSAIPDYQFDYWRGFAGQGHYEHQDGGGAPRHLTSIMEEQAVEFLQLCSADQPFCLSVSFKAPHVQDGDPRQFVFDPQLAHLFENAVIPVPPTAGDEFFYRFPQFFTADNEARRRWQLRFSTPEKYQQMVKGYYRLIAGIDRAIGRIRRQLSDSGFAENTVIIFSSDNGFYLGEHGLAGKWYGHEPSIRIPLIIYDPRLPVPLRGRQCDQIALNIDLAPTIMDLAGRQAPRSMQGATLLPLLREQATIRDEFFYEHPFEHPRIPQSEGVVSADWKYLCYYQQQPVFEELYDLNADPLETENLVLSPEHQERLGKLRQARNDYRRRLQ